MRRLLPVLLLAALALPASAEVDPNDAAIALPVELSDPDATDVQIEIPPSLFAYLRHGTDDLFVVDGDGKRLDGHVLTRDGNAPSVRADLEPRLVSQSASARGLSLLFDLRVRAAPGMALELDLRGPIDPPLHVSDASDPRTGPWEEIPFVASETTDERLVGRAVVPSGAGKRFVRVVVPTRAATDVRVARAAATVPRHRLHFRTAGAQPPFTLVAGFDTHAGTTGPDVSAPIHAWGSGSPARVDAPAWLPPEPGLRAASTSGTQGGGRPTPWAEIVATILTLALTIWAVLLRKEG